MPHRQCSSNSDWTVLCANDNYDQPTTVTIFDVERTYLCTSLFCIGRHAQKFLCVAYWERGDYSLKTDDHFDLDLMGFMRVNKFNSNIVNYLFKREHGYAPKLCAQIHEG